MFRKATVLGLTAAVAALSCMMMPQTVSAAGMMGQIYFPKERSVSLSGSDDMGVGFDLDEAMGSRKKAKEIARPEIWLIGAHIDFKTLSQDTIDAWYREKKVPAGQPIFYQETDTMGNFSIQDVPAGDYYLVVVNNYVPGNGSDPQAVKDLAQYLPDYEMFQLFVTGYSEPTAIEFHLAEDEIGLFNTAPTPDQD